MAAVVESLSSGTGIAPDMVRNALGAIFGFLKRHLDPETLGKIQAALPGGELHLVHVGLECSEELDLERVEDAGLNLRHRRQST